MTLEVRPLGVVCNLKCHYCYQGNQRSTARAKPKYDLNKIKERVLESKSPFSLFGGEILLLNLTDLEDLLSFGLQHFNENGIQTNGTLIRDEHLKLFKKYKVFVGVSIDGPGELNDIRWGGTLKKTRKNTATIEYNIERLINAGISTSIIVTLHRENASKEKLPTLLQWLTHLDNIGVASARIHDLEVESDEIETKYALTQEENIHAFLAIASIEQDFKKMHLDVFEDIKSMLLGKEHGVTCIWRACDPYTTEAVHGVEGDGEMSNCGRTNKEGIDFIKAITPGYERNIALYHTPQEYGGCNGCTYFIFCKGQCPGTGIGQDWRNRSANCGLWKELFKHTEQKLIENNVKPITQSHDLTLLEEHLLEYWENGGNPTLQELVNACRPTPPLWVAGQVNLENTLLLDALPRSSPLYSAPLLTPSWSELLDTDVVLSAAQTNRSECFKMYPPLLSQNLDPDFFDGAISLNHLHAQSPYIKHNITNGSIKSRNLYLASSLIKTNWSECFEQIKSCITVINPLQELNCSGSAGTSISGCFEHEFGVIYATTENPISLAQAIIQQTAQQKLFALGIHLKNACCWFSNSPDELTYNPFKNCDTPLVELFISFYSFTHVLQFEVFIEERGTNYDHQFLKQEMAKNHNRLRIAFEGVRRNIKPTSGGEAHIAGLLSWCNSLLSQSVPSANNSCDPSCVSSF